MGEKKKGLMTAACYGGPLDGEVFAREGCELDVDYEFYARDGRPVNVPLYRLGLRDGKWRFEFMGYAQ